jgi:hypothetical protein
LLKIRSKLVSLREGKTNAILMKSAAANSTAI